MYHPSLFVEAPSSTRREQGTQLDPVYAPPVPAQHPGLPQYHNGQAPTIPFFPERSPNYYNPRRPPGYENTDIAFNPERWGHPYATDMTPGPGSRPRTIRQGKKRFNLHAPSKTGGSRN